MADRDRIVVSIIIYIAIERGVKILQNLSPRRPTSNLTIDVCQRIFTVMQVFLGWQVAIPEMAGSRCVDNAFTSSSCLRGPIVFIRAHGRRPIADDMMKQNYLVLCTPNNICIY